MIVVTNSYIPTGFTKKLPVKKGDKPIAETGAGDLAYYTTEIKREKRKRKGGYDSDGSDDSDDDERMKFDFSPDEDDLGRPISSLSGAMWRPRFNDRLTMFIAGLPGAGKSYLAKEMINLLPRTTNILLFTALEENDGNFDDLGKERIFKIKMKPEVLSQIKLSEIRSKSESPQTLLLFDDVDKISDSKVQKWVFSIMNDALANGRGHEKHDGKGDLHVICTSHSLNDYQKTKYAFENSNYIAMFPGATPVLQLQLMFNKLGLDKELCAKMIKLGRQQKIRSIIVHKVVPLYMIYGKKIMLL